MPLFNFFTAKNQEVTLNLVKVSPARTLIVLSAVLNPVNKQYIPLKKQVDDNAILKENLMKNLVPLVKVQNGMITIETKQTKTV